MVVCEISSTWNGYYNILEEEISICCLGWYKVRTKTKETVVLSFSITKVWVLEILGGLALGIVLRLTDVLFMLRGALFESSNWLGLAGPEYLALILGSFSRLGAGTFIIFTALTGGINGVELFCTLVALGIWEWQVRGKVIFVTPAQCGKLTNKKVGVGGKPLREFVNQPWIWSWIALFVLGFLSLRVLV